MNSGHLPVTRSLVPIYILSLIIGLLMAVASLAGLLFQSAVYPTDELRRSFVSNDVVNLLIGLPILLGSMTLAWRGKLIGLLFWPGALFYIAYNSIAYSISMSSGLMLLPYLMLAALSVAAMIGLLTGIDSAAIKQRLNARVPERFAAGVLIGFGALYFARAIGILINVVNGQMTLDTPETAVGVADFITTPFWLMVGVLLWRKRAPGYAAGTGLLFQASMLFIGLLVFFILQPVVAGVPFPMNDFIVILVMGMICFIPFGLFVRGVLSSGQND